MGKERKVYVITSGCYSCYHIKGIFDSREKADEYVNYSSDCELNDIEEWNLNELQLDRGEKTFELISDFESIGFEVSRCLESTSAFKDLMCLKSDRGWGSKDYIIFYVCADTRERAIKIASERLRQVKAEEYFRYPMLRKAITVNQYGQAERIFPFVHCCTGEIVLPTGCTLISNPIQGGYKPSVKIITMKELKGRLKEVTE